MTSRWRRICWRKGGRAFLLAWILVGLAIFYTMLFSQGLLLYPTLRIEQWLLYRRLTNGDCVLREWGQVGDVVVIFIGVLLLGCICRMLGYRWRVVCYLLLLLLVEVGIEQIGKVVFVQTMPDALRTGMSLLSCPQLDAASSKIQFQVLIGMWWKVPHISFYNAKLVHLSAKIPLSIHKNGYAYYGYPSGHAMRSCFLYITSSWLCYRHVGHRLLRSLFVLVAGIMSMGAGLIQLYIGFHLISDLGIGYLLGGSAACWAIGILQRNYVGKRTCNTTKSHQGGRIETSNIVKE